MYSRLLSAIEFIGYLCLQNVKHMKSTNQLSCRWKWKLEEGNMGWGNKNRYRDRRFCSAVFFFIIYLFMAVGCFTLWNKGMIVCFISTPPPHPYANHIPMFYKNCSVTWIIWLSWPWPGIVDSLTLTLVLTLWVEFCKNGSVWQSNIQDVAWLRTDLYFLFQWD